MAVAHQLRRAQVRERLLELHVARVHRVGRAHERVADVVADPGQRAVTDQLVAAQLFARAAHGRILRMVRCQAHRRPHLEGPAGHTDAALYVVLERVVVEQVELQ